MMQRRRLSLRLKLTAVVAVLLTLMALFLGAWIPLRMNATAERWAERHAEGITLLLVPAVRPAFDTADVMGAEELQSALGMLAGAPGALYGMVRRTDETPVAAWKTSSATEIPPPRQVGEREVEVWRDGGALHVQVVFLTPPPQPRRGVLQVGFSMATQMRERGEAMVVISGVMIAVFALGLLVLSLVLGQLLIKPITRLTRTTAAVIASGDLSQEIHAGSNDEIGELSESFRQMVEWQRTLLRALRGLTGALAEVIGQITQAGDAVADGTTTIQARVGESADRMQEMLISLGRIEQSVEVLNQSAEQGSSVIHEMAAVNEHAVGDTKAMASFVGETTTAIDRMALSIREIAGSIEQVNAAVRDTSTSMSQLESSVLQVEQNASRTASLSARVSTKADTGVVALHKTLGGIEKIKVSFDTASQTLDQLTRGISEVGSILHVIDDITEQTNLLALNAAIISAQAGEHGRGFSVVAEEIRALADRTKTSTKEITALIKNIQESSQQALDAMGEGGAAVHQGVQLGQEASQALEAIQEAARQATEMVQHIARATQEQSAGNKTVTAALSRIAETMAQITRASNEQAQGSEQIIISTGKMKEINQKVFTSSQEQAAGSSSVIESIDRINTMVREVGERQQEQTHTVDMVLEVVGAIEAVSEQQGGSVRHLEAVIERLRAQAADLQGELERFRTD